METHVVELDTPLRLRIDPAGCTHLDQIRDVTAGARVCEECRRMGDDWFHLRVCRWCGHVGCCDDSKNRHATGHHHETGHAIIQSLQPGEDWMYCYVDNVLMEPVE